MKFPIHSKQLAALISAAAVSLYSVAPSAAAASLNAARRNYDDDELVRIIVQLYGDPILAKADASMGADYLDTASARERAEELKNKREYIFDEIQRLYPDAELEFTYDSVFNGFACTVPSGMKEDIEAMRGVKAAVVSQEQIIPKMYEANDVSNVNAYQNETGLTGEGQVIAVIDTELDTEHEMFAPLADDINVSITKDDISHVIEERGLSRELDSDKVYRSNKIPFAVSYFNEDDPYTVSNEDPEAYHGTHVSGIAAGNRVTVTTPYTGEEVEMHGVAPDAQLIFFSVGDGSIDDSAAIAAIEDAVTIGADVINMSFGIASQHPDSYMMYDDIFNTAEDAGIMLCVAAGNDGASMQSAPAVNVDHASISSPSLMGPALSVAASSATFVPAAALPDGTTFGFNDFGMENTTGIIEYVDCGNAADADLDGIDLTDKYALFYADNEDDIISLSETVSSMGAQGIIYYGPEGPSPYLGFMVYVTNALYVTEDTAAAMTASEEKILDLDSAGGSYDSRVSLFSSVGPLQTLELKPEITAPGEDILSASYDGYKYMAGTSMASPFMAGCAALTNQFLTENNMNAEGVERTKLIKNLLMTSATPMSDENGVYQSPRRQGAGLVNMDAVTKDTVLMLGTNGKTAVELGDHTDFSFSFDMTLKNISDKDVTFNDADVAMTTDSIYYDDFMGWWLTDQNAAPLDTTFLLSEEVITVPAGSEKTVTVNVMIDPDDMAVMDDYYIYGWFMDGFITLSGSDDCCDISMPIIGFHGDWLDLPILESDLLDTDTYSLFLNSCIVSDLGQYYIPASFSLAENAAWNHKYQQLKSKLMPDDDFWMFDDLTTFDEDMTTFDEDFLSDLDFPTFDEDALSDYTEKLEELNLTDRDVRYKASRHDYVISSNGDNVFDKFNYYGYALRDNTIYEMKLFDENGNEVAGHGTIETPLSINLAGMRTALLSDISDSPLPEGKYTAEIYSHTFAKGGEDRPEVRKVDFTVDNTRPELEEAIITEEGGRRILTMSVSDERLEGIYIIGKGNGGIKGSENMESMDLSVMNIELLGNLLPTKVDEELPSDGEDDITSDTEDQENDTPLPDHLGLLDFISDMDTCPERIEHDFLDIIPAEADEDGRMTISYDITDLTDFTITITDRGYNMTTYSSDTPFVGSIPSQTVLKSGDRLCPVQTPEMIFDGSISEQGWEIYDRISDTWQPISEDTLANTSHNECLLHYAASGDGSVGYSNPMTVIMSDAYYIDMTVYTDGKFYFSTRVTPQNYDFGVYDMDTSFTVELSYDGYAPRTIEIPTDAEDKTADLYLYAYGDVNGDEKINVTDISAEAGYIKGIKELDDYPKAAADVNGDGTVNVTDLSRIAAQVKGIKNIND